MKKYYSISKENVYFEINYLDYKKLRGFKFTPKNKVKYNGVKVNKLIVVKLSLTNNILKKKIKRKLDMYLKYVVQILDSDDEDSGVIELALNDLERYRRTVINKYQLYLEKKYTNLLLKKIDLLEHELKTKLMYINYYTDEDTKGKSR